MQKCAAGKGHGGFRSSPSKPASVNSRRAEVCFEGRSVRHGLLVIPDAAAQVAYPGNEAYLGNQWCGRARLWKHVAACLGDLTFRLLCRGIDFLINLLTRR